MSDVAGARGRLDAVNTVIAQAMTAAQTAAGLFAEAHTALVSLRGTSNASLGDGACDVARQQCEQAFVRGHAAIEANETYGATL
jgi:hypothetical protein